LTEYQLVMDGHMGVKLGTEEGTDRWTDGQTGYTVLA